MYPWMPEANLWPNCQAQIAETETNHPMTRYHRCEIGPPPGHVFHQCICGYSWNDLGWAHTEP